MKGLRSPHSDEIEFRGGKIRMKACVAAAVVLLSATTIGRADSVESAYKICMVLDNTGYLTEPCEVSGWGSSVNIRMDMSAPLARALCVKVADAAKGNGWLFDDRWTLKIYSPYSGDNTVAFCPL